LVESSGTDTEVKIVPDVVSLNTMLKQWFESPPVTLVTTLGSGMDLPTAPLPIGALAEAEALVAATARKFAIRPDTRTINSLVRIATREPPFPQVQLTAPIFACD
jgi:hypothetical protein